MTTVTQIMGEIRSASARGDFDGALWRVKELPEHMREGVRAGLMRTHQLEVCTVCEGEGSWEASFGWGEGEGCDRHIPCLVCEEHGVTTPEDREEWREQLAKGEEACDEITEIVAQAPDFWDPPDDWDYREGW